MLMEIYRTGQQWPVLILNILFSLSRLISLVNTDHERRFLSAFRSALHKGIIASYKFLINLIILISK